MTWELVSSKDFSRRQFEDQSRCGVFGGGAGGLGWSGPLRVECKRVLRFGQEDEVERRM